jgi:anti-sigma regulatory factor (Ser/Thr protein kinase)
VEQPEDDAVFNGPGAAERARSAARALLETIAADRPHCREDVLLVVSELINNANLHAGGVTRFHLSADRRTITVTVEDASPVAPRYLGPDPTRPGGFGWPLVHRLSDEVVVDLRPDGKTIRAVLLCS